MKAYPKDATRYLCTIDVDNFSTFLGDGDNLKYVFTRSVDNLSTIFLIYSMLVSDYPHITCDYPLALLFYPHAIHLWKKRWISYPPELKPLQKRLYDLGKQFSKFFLGVYPLIHSPYYCYGNILILLIIKNLSI